MRTDRERGLKMKKRRLEMGLSREKAGEMLGVHRNTIGNWDKGMMPRADILPAVLDLYGFERDFFADPLTEFERAVLSELSDLRERLASKA